MLGEQMLSSPKEKLKVPSNVTRSIRQGIVVYHK